MDYKLPHVQSIIIAHKPYSFDDDKVSMMSDAWDDDWF